MGERAAVERATGGDDGSLRSRGPAPAARGAPGAAPARAGGGAALALRRRLPDRGGDRPLPRLPAHDRRDPRLDHHVAGGAPAPAGGPPAEALTGRNREGAGGWEAGRRPRRVAPWWARHGCP